MNKYKNSKIYAIKNHTNNLVYIGSTVNCIHHRFNMHLSKYIGWTVNPNTKYYSSFEIFKYEKPYVELIGVYDCINRNELERKEGEFIKSITNCINKNKPYVPTSDKKTLNPQYEKYIHNYKKYYIANKEKIIANSMQTYNDKKDTEKFKEQKRKWNYTAYQKRIKNKKI